MTKILVTGGSGFIGQRLLNVLIKKKYSIRSTYYDSTIEIDKLVTSDVEWIKCNLVDGGIDYSKLLCGIDVVVHLAGFAHVLKSNKQTDKLFRKVNVESTEKLAKNAAGHGVQQFIFISSIKVNGESTERNSWHEYTCFNEAEMENPVGQYAISKFEAENKLKEICSLTEMKYTIFRPPIIYGPGVKANFLKLIEIIDKGIPLPFSALVNQRSMLYVDNFCNAIVKCIDENKARNELFLIKDIDCSMVELINIIASTLDKPSRLFPFPISLIQLLSSAVGRKDQISKFTESLLIDDSHIRNKLGWIPEIKFDDAIKATTDWYKGLPMDRKG